MLWQRVVTSFVLLGLILGAVFGLSEMLFALFIFVVMSVALWEWSALTGLSSVPGKVIYVAVLLGIMFCSTLDGVPVNLLFLAAAGCWLVALLLIAIFPKAKAVWGTKPVLMCIGLPLFVPAWLALYTLRNQAFHEFYLLFLFFMVAAADIGAYFSGRALGNYKLAVRVSPNKTWEGFAGGVLACVVLMVVSAFLFPEKFPEMNPALLIQLIISAILIAAYSVIGDLFESMIKRFRDVKDSGAILPGHGGILDRIDGLTAAAPMYAILLLQVGAERL